MYQHISTEHGAAYAVDGHIVTFTRTGFVICTCGVPAGTYCDHRRKIEEMRRESMPLNSNRGFSLMR